MTGFASTPIPTAAGIEISMVALTALATWFLVSFRFFFAYSPEIPGISADAMADDSAMGILETFTALPTIPV